ncbi:MAG: hypothetical protein KC708_00080 [Anaerolineae bacterium]|nr:hypothetical protein [Anaerolineae bacterium]
MLRRAFNWINPVLLANRNMHFILHARQLLALGVLSLLLLTSCSGATDAPTSVATQRLMLATATSTQLPPTVTPTSEPLTSAIDINAANENSDEIIPLLAGDVSLPREFLTSIRSDLAQRLNLEPERIELGQIQHEIWTNANLGCVDSFPLEQTYAGYAIDWIVNTTVYSVHTNGERDYVVCSGTHSLDGELLLAVDAIAADMFGLVQRRLSRELDLPQQRIRLVSINTVTWPDNSLGCPQPDEAYTSATLRGYRIEVLVGETTYIFHTDDSRLVACTPEREVLP